MQVSGSAGASAASLLQRLFLSNESSAGPPAPPAESAGQKMPGGGGKCNAGGAGGPQMSAGSMSAMVGLQMGSPPSASEEASSLIDSLDANGDGELSAEEIEAALGEAAEGADITSILDTLDTDGNDALSADELTSAIENAHARRGPPPGGPPPSAEEGADALLSMFDTNEDSGLGLSEVASALGLDAEDEQLASSFASMDADGDGALSSAELAVAIQTAMDGVRAYAKTATLSAS